MWMLWRNKKNKNKKEYFYLLLEEFSISQLSYFFGPSHALLPMALRDDYILVGIFLLL